MRTITDYNYRNDGPLLNDKIQEAIHKVIAEEESDDHNITSDSHIVNADDFSQMPNTQRENENAILINEKLY